MESFLACVRLGTAGTLHGVAPSVLKEATCSIRQGVEIHLARLASPRSLRAIMLWSRLMQGGSETLARVHRGAMGAILSTRRPQGFAQTICFAGGRKFPLSPTCCRSSNCGGGDTGSRVRRLPIRSQRSVIGAGCGLGFWVVPPV
jgi:hypothetical protein